MSEHVCIVITTMCTNPWAQARYGQCLQLFGRLECVTVARMRMEINQHRQYPTTHPNEHANAHLDRFDSMTPSFPSLLSEDDKRPSILQLRVLRSVNMTKPLL